MEAKNEDDRKGVRKEVSNAWTRKREGGKEMTTKARGMPAAESGGGGGGLGNLGSALEYRSLRQSDATNLSQDFGRTIPISPPSSSIKLR